MKDFRELNDEISIPQTLAAWLQLDAAMTRSAMRMADEVDAANRRVLDRLDALKETP